MDDTVKIVVEDSFRRKLSKPPPLMVPVAGITRWHLRALGSILATLVIGGVLWGYVSAPRPVVLTENSTKEEFHAWAIAAMKRDVFAPGVRFSETWSARQFETEETRWEVSTKAGRQSVSASIHFRDGQPYLHAVFVDGTCVLADGKLTGEVDRHQHASDLADRLGSGKPYQVANVSAFLYPGWDTRDCYVIVPDGTRIATETALRETYAAMCRDMNEQMECKSVEIHAVGSRADAESHDWHRWMATIDVEACRKELPKDPPINWHDRTPKTRSE